MTHKLLTSAPSKFRGPELATAPVASRLEKPPRRSRAEARRQSPSAAPLAFRYDCGCAMQHPQERQGHVRSRERRLPDATLTDSVVNRSSNSRFCAANTRSNRPGKRRSSSSLRSQFLCRLPWASCLMTPASRRTRQCRVSADFVTPKSDLLHASPGAAATISTIARRVGRRAPT